VPDGAAQSLSLELALEPFNVAGVLPQLLVGGAFTDAGQAQRMASARLFAMPAATRVSTMSSSPRDQVSGLYLTATSVLWRSRLATRQVWSV
jgi:hypothetical protein